MKPAFQKGDIVRCIDAEDYNQALTEGNLYTVVQDSSREFTYVLMDHNGEQGGYLHRRFELAAKAATPPRKVVSVAERSQTTIVPGYDVTYDDGTTEWVAK